MLAAMSGESQTGNNAPSFGYFNPQISAANLKWSSRILVNKVRTVFLFRWASVMASTAHSGMLASSSSSSSRSDPFFQRFGSNSVLDQHCTSRSCEYEFNDERGGEKRASYTLSIFHSIESYSAPTCQSRHYRTLEKHSQTRFLKKRKLWALSSYNPPASSLSFRQNHISTMVSPKLIDRRALIVANWRAIWPCFGLLWLTHLNVSDRGLQTFGNQFKSGFCIHR